MQVPTLLVGLGGLGSHIVDEVYGKIPVDQRDKVAVMAFDTNINDIQKLKHINKSNIIQTSANYTVRQYVNRSPETVKEWFPNENGEVMRKRLTEGAGQVRAVSRLAYRAAIENHKMVKLQSNLNRIFSNDSAEFTASPRIMIVSTLAGGTGAGLFLQVALYLKDILAQKYNVQNALVRGAFLLPDILVSTGAIKKGKQIENIRANAYACIKELNAITRNAQGVGRKMAIELEYRPDLQDIDGRVNHYLSSDHLPYDFCFLYDDLNTKGKNLRHFSNYTQQVINSLYVDLFSPISAGTFSKQDNQIIDLVETDGLSRYCGTGASKIEYPYEDMLHYFSLKWFTDSLGADWLKIDKLYEDDLREYRKMIEQGGFAEKPHRGERFSHNLRNLATTENAKLFFRKAYNECFIQAKDGERGAAKSHSFIQAIESEIDRLSSSDNKLNAIKEYLYIDKDKLKNKDHALNVVRDMEEELERYRRAALKFVDQTKNYLINQILLSDEDAPKGHQDISYHLNTWLLNRIDPVHPIAARGILYDMERELERVTQNLAQNNKILLDSIKNYHKVYDIEETDDILETAEDRIRDAVDQSFTGRLLKNKFKQFVKEYQVNAEEQSYNLSLYVKSKLTEDVFNGVRKGLRILIANMERFFNNLSDVKDKLGAECNLYAKKHEGAGDDNRIFVLASEAMKNKLWEIVGMGTASHELPSDISEQIYLGQYKRFCTQQRGEYISDENPEKVEEMIREDVIKWATNYLRKEDRINFNILRALRKQAEFQGIEDSRIEEYIKGEIRKLDNLTSPLVPQPMRIEAAEFNTWGVHPEVVKEVSEAAANEIFEDERTVNEAFSAFEIIRSKSIYGMTIDDFNKFHCGDSDLHISPGTYFSAYMKRINKLQEDGKTVNPHLDKRWHSPYYLPDLHDVNVERINSKIVKALTYGLSLGLLKAVPYDGKYYWEFQGDNVNKWVNYNGNRAEADFHTLYDALNQSMGIVDSVLSKSKEMVAADKRTHKQDFRKYEFYENCTKIEYPMYSKSVNILDMFLDYFNYHSLTEEDRENGVQLLRSMVNEIMDFYLDVHGASMKNTAAKEVEKIFRHRLTKNSQLLNKMDNSVRLKNLLENQIKSLKK